MTNNIKKEGFFHGSRWVLVFYHDSSKGSFFDDSVAETCNIEYCSDEYRYSQVGKINELNKISSFYEFFLEYPEINSYVIWTQTIAPLAGAETSTERNNGFKLKQKRNATKFSGLMRSLQSSYAPIDGSDYPGNFWYTLGAKRSYTQGANAFTGPFYEVQKAYLWMRVGFLKCSLKRSILSNNSVFISFLIFTSIK